MAMVNSTIVEYGDVHESIVDGLIDGMGEMSDFFDVQIIVTVVVQPLPDAQPEGRYARFARKLWGCAG